MEKSTENRVKVALINFEPGGKIYAFRYPYWESLQTGEMVQLEDADKMGTVVMVDTFYERKELDKFLQTIGASWPLKKVLAYCRVNELDYSEEEVINDGEAV
jgi:hypothetical protein